jgi:hypothetical protein
MKEEIEDESLQLTTDDESSTTWKDGRKSKV